MYLKTIMNEAFEERGYNVCMISFRGQSGGNLVTPKLYNMMSVDDFKEPMEYVCNKIKPTKAYAIGCSMGSMVLSNYLGVY